MFHIDPVFSPWTFTSPPSIKENQNQTAAEPGTDGLGKSNMEWLIIWFVPHKVCNWMWYLMINNSKLRCKARGDYRRNKYMYTNFKENEPSQKLKLLSQVTVHGNICFLVQVCFQCLNPGDFRPAGFPICSQSFAKTTDLRSCHPCTTLLHTRHCWSWFWQQESFAKQTRFLLYMWFFGLFFPSFWVKSDCLLHSFIKAKITSHN